LLDGDEAALIAVDVADHTDHASDRNSHNRDENRVEPTGPTEYR